MPLGASSIGWNPIQKMKLGTLLLYILVLVPPTANVVAWISLPTDSRTIIRRRSQMDTRIQSMSTSSSKTAETIGTPSPNKGKLLVLGGTGFLGQTICRRAILEGYSVTSLSRRGLPPSVSSSTTTNSGISVSPTNGGSTSSTSSSKTNSIDYRKGDARTKEAITNILNEGGYVGVIHCIGLLFDDASGLGNWNRFVSGSGSLPDTQSTYDSITRLSAFNAIEATLEYLQLQTNDGRTSGSSSSTTTTTTRKTSFPFVFTSAAEAGWPDVPGGPQIEEFFAPEWLRRYLVAKRAVEGRLSSITLNQGLPTTADDLIDSSSSLGVGVSLRPIIPRPSLIYSLDRPASYIPVGAFFVGNQFLRLPFVDRPVTVQALANAIIKAISKEDVRGILRYPEIDELSR